MQKILFFILIAAGFSSCSHSYDAVTYHKPIRIIKLTTKDSVRPLYYYKSRTYSCKIHNCSFQLDTVPIHYGARLDEEETPKEGFLKAEESTFPNSSLSVGGGNKVSANSPTYAEVLFCPICRLHRQDWVGDDNDLSH